MPSLDAKSFDTPDEIRTPDKTKVDVVRLGAATIGRFTFQPGSKWSDCVKPVAGTEACQVRHVGTIVSGRLHVVHNDGTEADVEPDTHTSSNPATTPGLSATRRLWRSSSKARRRTRGANPKSRLPEPAATMPGVLRPALCYADDLIALCHSQEQASCPACARCRS